MSLFDKKTKQNMVYGFLGFSLCRTEVDNLDACKRNKVGDWDDPVECAEEKKKVKQCTDRIKKIDAEFVPLFNEAVKCMGATKNDVLKCKQQLNELISSQIDPTRYRELLQKKPAAAAGK